jgi:hypothetical protein
MPNKHDQKTIVTNCLSGCGCLSVLCVIGFILIGQIEVTRQPIETSQTNSQTSQPEPVDVLMGLDQKEQLAKVKQLYSEFNALAKHEQFAFYGISSAGPAGDWDERLETLRKSPSIEKRARSAADSLIALSSVLVQSRGEETELSAHHRNEIERILSEME